MKSPFVILIFVVLSLMIASPALAQSEDACPHHDMMATVQALIKCVQHASDQSFITEPDITDSLLDKLYSAQAAVDRSQPAVAVNILHAFVNQVQAQAGKHIVPAMHADHLEQHAQRVIAALDR
jgi:hypothetical protein